MARECNSTSCTKESCEGCASRNNPQSFQADPNPGSDIKHVIGVVSGKGGVGKSLVTASLANSLTSMGYAVGILDADITGPSIPRMYGLSEVENVVEQTIFPPSAANGVKIMSTNLLLPDEEEPVIWRGPVIANMVKQFWTDVAWGPLDFLLVDMPPGTGDVPLTVFQSLPLDGVIIVTSPQDLVRMIVSKAYHMAEKMQIPVLGLVENYSYITCPGCGTKIAVFGESHIDEIAKDLRVPVLGRIPIQPEYAKAADTGNFAGILNSYVDEAAAAMRDL